MIGLSERDGNLIASAIDLVAAARSGGDEHVTAWFDAIVVRTRTPAAADVAELIALRRALAAERFHGADTFRAEAPVR